MKIALEGAMSTGKTTIGELVAKKLGVTFIEEAARKALKAGFELDKGATFESQIWMLAYQYVGEFKCSEGFIADRGIMSIAVYTALNDTIKKSSKENIINLIKNELVGNKQYDKIIYFPPNVLKLEDDGVRCVDESFQKALHETYLKLFSDWGLDYYVLKSVEIEDRVEEICKLII